jgi:hypothetical protein
MWLFTVTRLSLRCSQNPPVDAIAGEISPVDSSTFYFLNRFKNGALCNFPWHGSFYGDGLDDDDDDDDDENSNNNILKGVNKMKQH